jgi:hypothetical protein
MYMYSSAFTFYCLFLQHTVVWKVKKIMWRLDRRPRKVTDKHVLYEIVELYMYYANIHIHCIHICMYRYNVIDAYQFYTAKKRPRDKTVSKKPPKKKAKTEGCLLSCMHVGYVSLIVLLLVYTAGTIHRIVAHDPPDPSVPGSSSVTDPTTSTKAGRSGVTEPPAPSVPVLSQVIEQSTPAVYITDYVQHLPC